MSKGTLIGIILRHVRRTSYRLVNWGRAKGKEQLRATETYWQKIISTIKHIQK